MPAFRILAAGAAFLVMTAASAGAQTATDTAAGKPIPLLKIVSQPDKTKTRVPHAQRFSRAAGKTRIAAGHRRPRHPAQAASVAAAPAKIWPEPETTAATNVAAAEPQQPPASTPSEPPPNELVVQGRTVEVVSPDEPNEIDLAADMPEAAATKGPRSDITETGAAAAEAKPGSVLVARPQAPSPVGSTAWIAQVLAAIGGAAAAASVAWFLIGSVPQRTYG